MALNPAIGWVQFKLVGGARNQIFVACAYSAAVVALMAFSTQMDYRPSLATLGHFVPMFTFVQLIVLLLWGTVRVGNAVRLDVTSGVLESHRLMPISPVSAILGYLFGSTTQVFTIFFINILLGSACVAEANVPVRLWLVASAVMVLYAVMVWSAVIFFSFRFGPAAYFMVGLQLVMVIAQNARTVLLPGLGMIAAPVFTESLFRLKNLDSIELSLMIACALQALIAGVYILAASSRYLRDSGPAFDWPLAILLFVLWIIACAVGIALPQYEWRRFQSYYYDRDVVTTFATTLAAICLLGILPIASAIRSRRVSPMLIAIVVALLSALMLDVAPRTTGHLALRYIYTGVELLAFFVAMRYVIGLAIARRMPNWLCVSIWLFVLWIVPTMIDAVITMNVPYSMNRTVFTWSPVVSLPAAIYSSWDPSAQWDEVQSWGAPVAQLLFAALAAALFHAFRRERAVPAVVAAGPELAQAPADLIAN